ncbi:MAG: hypothetical protein ACLPID_07110 [Beijerinckiaceae bacterium]
MIRLAFRLLGLILLAGAFTALIIDGTRTIAGGGLSMTPFGETLLWVAPKFSSLQPQIEHFNSYLWNPVTITLLRLPTFAIAGIIGFLALALSQKKRATIGYSSRD